MPPPQVFCIAADIVQRLRDDAGALAAVPAAPASSSSSAGSVGGAGGAAGESPFSTLHVRRGDFQFKAAKIPVEEVVATTGGLFRPGELLYVATDEADVSFLEPLRLAGHAVRTLNDYLPAGERKRLANPDWVGMVEQVVAAQGRVFVGTYWSTFTAYVVRMRGYQGHAKRSFYSLAKYRDVYATGTERRKGAGWWREWPEAWEGIDGA
jgi:hypothetical protein